MAVEQVKERDAGNKIVKFAKILVTLVTTFGGYLKQKYGADSPIGLLIDAIIALGALLPDADALVVEYGGNNDTPETDPEHIIGIRPGAPEPPDPPEPPV